MSAARTAEERAEQRRADWIAARLAEAPPLSAQQQHVIRRAFAAAPAAQIGRAAA
ncbi:hypothetical protein [Nocardia sp. No.11]|uniref:hypothetical protein n=1 Tax=Nocardia sp. No.11 TaxID=3128861 RepID=UPI00319E4389